MIETKKVSVIIPIYNAEKYLRECLDSVIGQTYTNIEILCVNDGSTDHSLDICIEYQSRDKRIQIIDKENGGVSSARNHGLNDATGYYIAFLDSDDYYKKNAIETMVEAMSKNDVDVAFGRIDTSTIDKSSLDAFGPVEIKFGTPKEAMLVALKKHAYGTMLCNKMFRSKVINDNGEIIRFNESLKCGEDEVWLFEVLHNCRNVSFLSEEIYYWRVREDSAYREKSISDTNVDDVKAQEILLSDNLCHGEDVRETVQIVLNRKVLQYLVSSYVQKKKNYYCLFKEYDKRYKKMWYASRNVKLAAKAKRALIIGLMNVHFPACFAEGLYNLR